MAKLDRFSHDGSVNATGQQSGPGEAIDNTPQLLVSVRDAREAIAAINGGAAIIDVKEPARGALGQADPEVINAIVREVADRRPISVALGELVEWNGNGPHIVVGVSFAMVGLAGCTSQPDWKKRLLNLRALIETGSAAGLVAVAYADWQRANAPSVDEVFEFALIHRFPVLLVDTWRKDGTTLLDWLGKSELIELCEKVRASGMRVALAGSLDRSKIRSLRSVRPTWFAVRGAACMGGQRGARIDERRVKDLVESLAARIGTESKEQPCDTP
jgi:(5-formylfuran-3-yl)methyl phosphate synthase